MSATSGSSTYRLERAVVLRVIGPILIISGVGWVVVGALGGGAAVRIAMALGTLILAAAAVVAVMRPPRVLALSATGFRVSLVRGAGTTSGSWAEVDSVDTRVSRGGPSIVMCLAGERFSVIPMSLLGRRNIEAQREIHHRLNDAHGYRHLDAS